MAFGPRPKSIVPPLTPCFLPANGAAPRGRPHRPSRPPLIETLVLLLAGLPGIKASERTAEAEPIEHFPDPYTNVENINTTAVPPRGGATATTTVKGG